ncbi:hypothetical protein EON83_20225 [bacterium]|nr:MAG: hypothetical protein EON83_20225 [bacterium]
MIPAFVRLFRGAFLFFTIMDIKKPTKAIESPERAALFDPDLLYAEDDNGNRLTDEEVVASLENYSGEENEDEEPTDYRSLLSPSQDSRNQAYAAELLRRTRGRTLGY